MFLLQRLQSVPKHERSPHVQAALMENKDRYNKALLAVSWYEGNGLRMCPGFEYLYEYSRTTSFVPCKIMVNVSEMNGKSYLENSV